MKMGQMGAEGHLTKIEAGHWLSSYFSLPLQMLCLSETYTEASKKKIFVTLKILLRFISC